MSTVEKEMDDFEARVFKATRSICELMENRDKIEVLELMLEVLFFRNAHLFETIVTTLSNRYLVGGELLLRGMFEGTVILEWCLVEPKSRAQCFQRTAMEGTLELIQDGFLSRAEEHANTLREVVAHCAKEGVKRLPPFRQMVESLQTYQKGFAYNLYKYLSKNAHAVCVEWGDFLDCSGEKTRVCPVAEPPPERLLTCRATNSFLQMQNILLISSFDTSLRDEGCLDLERHWARLYYALYASGR